MYVCVCRGVTEKMLREAIVQGADRMRDLKADLGVTEQCGICACHVKQILDQARVQQPKVQDLHPKTVCLCESAA